MARTREEAVGLYAAGASAKEAAAGTLNPDTGRPFDPATVARWARGAGIRRTRGNRGRPDVPDAEIAYLMSCGLSVRQIGRLYRMSGSAVHARYLRAVESRTPAC